jgi:hypothetical protein
MSALVLNGHLVPALLRRRLAVARRAADASLAVVVVVVGPVSDGGISSASLTRSVVPACHAGVEFLISVIFEHFSAPPPFTGRTHLQS